MKFFIPCLGVGVTLLFSCCVAVDDPAVPTDPAPPESTLARPESAPVRSRRVLFGSEPAPARSEPAPARSALIPSRSESNADVPGWQDGYERGKEDAHRGLSQTPDRYDFIYSQADRAGFFRGYEAGYNR